MQIADHKCHSLSVEDGLGISMILLFDMNRSLKSVLRQYLGMQMRGGLGGAVDSSCGCATLMSALFKTVKSLQLSLGHFSLTSKSRIRQKVKSTFRTSQTGFQVNPSQKTSPIVVYRAAQQRQRNSKSIPKKPAVGFSLPLKFLNLLLGVPV